MYMDFSAEQLQTGQSMVSKEKLSSPHLLELYHILLPICELLDNDEPDSYLEMSPFTNIINFEPENNEKTSLNKKLNKQGLIE